MDSGPNLRMGPPWTPDKYTLVRQIGGGGEAVLWLAELSVDGAAEPVVVKELRPDQLDDIASHSARWAEQAELLRFVRHPGVVAVREHFQGAPMHRAGEATAEDKRSLYLVMNWVEGRSLSAWMSSNRELVGSAQALEHLDQIAEVLDLLHSGKATPSGRKIVHGDLSPGNVMITPAGQAVLIDFGLVRLSSNNAHDAAGTPGYTAPEVWASGTYSPSADRYSFGALAYLTLTGTNPPNTPADIRDGLAAHPLLDGVSLAAMDRLMSIFSADPDERPSAADWVRVLRNSAPTHSGLAGGEASTEAWSPTPRGSNPAIVSARTPAGAQARAGEQPITGGVSVITPSRPGPTTRRHRPKILYAILAGVTALALIIAGVVIVPQLINKPTEVFAESANTVGPNPFVAGIVPPAPPVTPVNIPSNGTATPDVTGDTPGLYGGVQSNPSYDTTQLVSALQSDPAKAQAWADSFNDPPSGIDTTMPSSGSNANSSSNGGNGSSSSFGGVTVTLANMSGLVAGLNLGVTRGIIRVTGIGYVNGQAVPFQLILGPGTPVLLNSFGVPIIRVASGTPLLAPIPIQGTPQVVTVGTGWLGWDPSNPMNGVYTISPASQPIATFIFYDLATGQLFTVALGAALAVQAAPAPAPVVQPQPVPPAVQQAAPPPAVVAQPAPHLVEPAAPPAIIYRHAPQLHRFVPGPQQPAPDVQRFEPEQHPSDRHPSDRHPSDRHPSDQASNSSGGEHQGQRPQTRPQPQRQQTAAGNGHCERSGDHVVCRRGT